MCATASRCLAHGQGLLALRRAAQGWCGPCVRSLSVQGQFRAWLNRVVLSYGNLTRCQHGRPRVLPTALPMPRHMQMVFCVSQGVISRAVCKYQSTQRTIANLLLSPLIPRREQIVHRACPSGRNSLCYSVRFHPAVSLPQLPALACNGMPQLGIAC